ncbi:MAG: AAA family ATPase [Planctomycetota bacterium]
MGGFEGILRRAELPESGEDAARDAAAYPYALPCVRRIGEIEFHPRVTFLIGENGSGKSTVVEALAVALGMNPEGGGRNFNFSTRDSHSVLGRELRLVRPARKARDTYFLRAESFYNVASEIDRLGVKKAYGGRSLHTRSHGESFLDLMLHRFGDGGLYLLDEPESALSPSRQLAALRVIEDLSSRGSQFIIATHSPLMMAYPNAWIYEFTSEGPERVGFESTEHYAVTRWFLMHPERAFGELLADDEGDGASGA